MSDELRDSDKLLLLAAWFDMWDRPETDRQAILDDSRNPGRNDVQRDLRRIAAALAARPDSPALDCAGCRVYHDLGHPDRVPVDGAAEAPERPAPDPLTEYGHCGSLAWTVDRYGRITHKHGCPNRTDPWCQTHPEWCPA